VSEAAITVRGLGKSYRLAGAARPRRSCAGACGDLATAPLRTLRALWAGSARTSRSGPCATFSFTVAPGEAVGIIGRNGAGKSTLLKLLSRITPPSTARSPARRVGQPARGRHGVPPRVHRAARNIYVTGRSSACARPRSTPGSTRIRRFAGVDRFLDTPVKHYSSGMYVRLAFAVAAHLEPEILLVDEILAVGDVGVPAALSGQGCARSRGMPGGTVLFVSHNLAAVKDLCPRVVLVRDGTLQLDGPADACHRCLRRRDPRRPARR